MFIQSRRCSISCIGGFGVLSIGAAAAAKAEGVSYPTVLKWMKENGTAKKISSLPASTISSIDRQIEQTEKEIEELNGELAKKKAALKTLKKAREKTEKVEQKAAEAAEKTIPGQERSSCRRLGTTI